MPPPIASGPPEPPRGTGEDFSKIETILLLGSGALKIGEAGEFDYSGSQAIKAFKEEGKRVILINPNIATNQTSWGLADAVYFVPVTPAFVAQVIEKEKPDAIALSFGGQTALNCGLQLEERGILAAHGLRVLGTNIESIRKTEDRALFNRELQSIGVAVPRSFAVTSLQEAEDAARDIGFPVIIRGAFALGGKGSGRAMNARELKDIAKVAFVESPQILVEEDLTGWKEIEYEVVRDRADNCITVCNMENVDPLGIHTGESIVIAPSQTLDNAEYHWLRSIALRVIRHLGIVGECNIQYALDPRSRDYRVIEVNARLSRSSALASKATGYPLAFVAAKLAMGYTLPRLRNAITRVTCADFEPALDYVAVKMPRWDLQKFRFASEQVTSEMKSVGEVMALGRTFEEALQKAIRMLNIGEEGLYPHTISCPDLARELKKPTPRRIFAVAEALSGQWSVEEVNVATGIDPWFLERIRSCGILARELFQGKAAPLGTDTLRRAKKAGYSDRGIATIREEKPEEIRRLRTEAGITPVIKQIDTLAGEFPAQTNYLYMTYHGTEDDVFVSVSSTPLPPPPPEEGENPLTGTRAEKNEETTKNNIHTPSPGGQVGGEERGLGGEAETTTNNKPSLIVLGGGPYAIGSSVEFDWCCVQAAHELQRQGYRVMMINSNPETVSTDYDECDALFFEELTEERVRDIAERTHPATGIVVSMGGQIPNSLARKLAAAGLPLLGTDSADIDRAEDRHKFSAFLDELGVDQPEWKEFAEMGSAQAFCESVGYPVIVRPSYVLSGAAMAVVHSSEDLEAFLRQASLVSRDSPVVISKFEQGAKEIDFDGVAQNGQLLLYAVCEHVENAGVHSGDATMVLPPQRVNLATLRQLKVIAKRIAGGLRISGPFNIQFLAKSNRLKVIECNVRASRSFPFASKVTGQNFAVLATQALLGKAPPHKRYQTVDLDHVGVKAAQFSFGRLKGADPRLGVEMASTGEVACFGRNAEQALLLSLLAVGFRIPQKSILITVGRLEDKLELLSTVQALHARGFSFFATDRTHSFLQSRGVPTALLHKVSEPRSPGILEYLEQKRVDLVINIPTHESLQEQTDGYAIRRTAIDHGIPLLTNVQLAKRVVEALLQEDVEKIPLLRWPEVLEAR